MYLGPPCYGYALNCYFAIPLFADNHMKANPDKFQAIAVGKRTKDENITFNLDNNIIHCEDHVKLLGVTIDFKLSFDLHISNV